MLLYAPQVDIQAGIAAQGGRIQAGNVLRQVNDRGVIEDVLVRPATGKPAGVTLAAGATLDVSGLWTNAALDPAASPGLARRNGGQVALRSSGSIALGQGSLVDVSGGAAIQSGGKARPAGAAICCWRPDRRGRPACWRWTARWPRAAWTAAAS